MRACLPLHLQLLAALHGGPGAVGNHRHSTQSLEKVRSLEIWNHYNVRNSSNFAGLGIVMALVLAAINRRPFNRCKHHAWHFGVHAKGTFAVNQIVQVNHRHVFANVLVITFLFESQFFDFRNGLFGCQSHQCAVTQFLAAGMNHFVVHGMAFAGGHFPPFSSSPFQH